MPNGAPLIGCSLLGIGYPHRLVAGGIDAVWTVGTGALALTGANGSGKSTFLKTCLGLLKPCAGSLHILGNPVRDGSFRQALLSIGWVPQQRTPGGLRLTVAELVALGLGPRLGLRPDTSKVDSAAIEKALCACGIADLGEEAVQDLSGGQYQRASLARALVGKPQLLLLDEPTTFLDRDSRKSILELLAALATQEGPFLALVSHDPELIALCKGFWLFADSTMQVVDRQEALRRCS